MKPIGLMPSAFAFSSDISSTAAAPSVSGEALPAVIVPYLRSKTGRSFAIASSVESPRMRLSVSTMLSNDGGTTTVITSSLKRPLAVAAAARWWLCSANLSCASRVMPFSLAIFSADSPMVRPVVDSAIAGASGARSFGRIFENAPSLPVSDFCLLAETSASANFFEKRIGTSDSDSAPPAMTVSA
jgi:hypothetical protein